MALVVCAVGVYGWSLVMEFDLEKLSKILMVGGLAVMIGAFGWWYSFYSSIANELTEVMKLSKQLVELRKRNYSPYCGVVTRV